MPKPVLMGTLRVLAGLGAAVATGVCLAQSEYDLTQTHGIHPTGITWRLTDETWKLPGGDRVGMVGGNLLFDVNRNFKLGVGSYGALRGNLGGFITLGVAAELHERITPSLRGEAGVFVGGGGGHGANALVGGGLMLRGHAGLSYDLGRYCRVGMGLSHVAFPSGTIRSTQPYLSYEYSFDSVNGHGWGGAPEGIAASDKKLLVRQQEFALVAHAYRIPNGVVQIGGAPQHPNMQLIGAEWSSYLDERWFLKLAADGAMGGQSSGYMQILAGGGYRWPIARGTAVKLHAALGPAGGGGVETGGGLLVSAGLALQQNISRRNALEVTVEKISAPGHSFNATSLSLKLSHQFGLPAANGFASWGELSRFDPQHLRVRFPSQTYFKGSSNWRTGSTKNTVGNLGVQLDYFIPGPSSSANFFLTGQGLAAFSDGAGAYMTGQLGAGAQWPLAARWFVEGEGLLGAAGGGGLAMGSGLVAQGNASVGYRLSKSLSLMATAGYMKALRGDFAATVLGMSLAYQFTAFAEK